MKNVGLKLEIQTRLTGAIERMGLSKDQERATKSALPLFVPEVVKIVEDAVRAEKSRKRAIAE